MFQWSFNNIAMHLLSSGSHSGMFAMFCFRQKCSLNCPHASKPAKDDKWAGDPGWVTSDVLHLCFWRCILSYLIDVTTIVNCLLWCTNLCWLSSIHMILDGVECLWARFMLNYNISSVVVLSLVLFGMEVIPWSLRLSPLIKRISEETTTVKLIQFGVLRQCCILSFVPLIRSYLSFGFSS